MASKSDGKTLMKFPPERIGHVAVCADKYMVVWGGYNVGSGFILNTVFLFLSRSKLALTFRAKTKGYILLPCRMILILRTQKNIYQQMRSGSTTRSSKSGLYIYMVY